MTNTNTDIYQEMSLTAGMLRLLKIEATVACRGRSRPQLYKDIKDGLMTPPVHIGSGKRISVWPSDEIEILNRAEISGASQDELRALVKTLMEKRGNARPDGPSSREMNLIRYREGRANGFLPEYTGIPLGK